VRERDFYRFVDNPKIGCVEENYDQYGHYEVKPEAIKFSTVDIHAEVRCDIEIYF
jgi:hypothetical protein